MNKLPISAVIATRNRANVLLKTLQSIHQQSFHPSELILIDASDGIDTQVLCHSLGFEKIGIDFQYVKATQRGAAVQRNQGVAISMNQYVWFLDDDVIFEPCCLERLWKAFQDNPNAGGVNAMITNQKYTLPGRVTRLLYFLMHGKRLGTYAGKCIGPAWNLLPEDNESLPEVVEVEWLNTGCTIYRKEALPTPVFDPHFTGYSLMEDLALSLRVGKKWKLYNARTARIFHDSQPGAHKDNVVALAKMELVNRHYVMTKILQRTTIKDLIKLMIFELFGIVSSMATIKGLKRTPQVIMGKAKGVFFILQSV